MDIEWYFSDFSRTASAVIMLIIFVGVALRKNRMLHPPMMLFCFAADLALLLYIEFSRSAIEHSANEMTTLLGIHIILAMGMLAGYGFLTQTGFALWRPKEGRDLVKIKQRHKIGAATFILLRIAVMATAVPVALEAQAAT